MADNKGKEEGEKKEEAAPPKKSKKTLFIALGVVLLLIVIGVPLALFLGTSAKKGESQSETVSADVASTKDKPLRVADAVEEEVEEGEEVLGAIAPLELFVVNLKGGRFLRAQIQLEFTERDIPSRLYQRSVLIRDAIITLLTSKSSDDVLDKEGKEKLKKEVRNLVNEVFKKELVKNVYFSQFVVQ